jgi:hypothetical protein
MQRRKLATTENLIASDTCQLNAYSLGFEEVAQCLRAAACKYSGRWRNKMVRVESLELQVPVHIMDNRPERVDFE